MESTNDCSCGQGHVVAEISDLDNEPLVKMVGGTVHTIVSHDVIGRLMIQVPRDLFCSSTLRS